MTDRLMRWLKGNAGGSAGDGTADEASISSSEVNRALRQTVWPMLKEHGFTRRTTRTAWRDRPDQVDVVNFQSFNSYNAGVLRVTTFSFAINLGVFPKCRATDATKLRHGELSPEEYECDFRHRLRRGLQQNHDSTDVWFVEPDGDNLTFIVEDARDRLLHAGLPWFAQLDGLEAMHARALGANEDLSGTWGMGNVDSPHRRELVAALSATLERRRR